MNEQIERIKRRRNLPPPPMRRLIRTQAKLSQEELADAVRAAMNPQRPVSGTTICRWEAGTRQPRKPYADAYADVLAELAEAVL